jgi:hypothetical protein
MVKIVQCFNANEVSLQLNSLGRELSTSHPPPPTSDSAGYANLYSRGKNTSGLGHVALEDAIQKKGKRKWVMIS